MTTQQVKIYDETSSVKLVAPNLWEVDRCFDDNTIRWLSGIKERENNKFFSAGLKKRLQLSTDSNDQLRLDNIGRAMMPSLSVIVDQKLSFLEAKFWIDLPEFGCQLHEDSPDIFVSYQVYLDSAILYAIGHRTAMTQEIANFLLDKQVGMSAQGAKFYHVDPPVQIEFRSNHGYVNLNLDLKKHDVYAAADTRVSVMFQYARV